MVDQEADTVTLAARIDDGAGYRPVSISPTEVQASSDGANVTLQWDAAETFAGSTRYRSDLVLEIVARDQHGLGPPARSEPFAYGNDPPAVGPVVVATDALGVAQGPTVIQLTVRDPSSDVARIEELRVAPADGSAAGFNILETNDAIISGDVQGLETSPEGVVHTLVWDTAVGDDGSRLPMLLSVRVSDALDTSAPEPSQVFEVDNAPSATIAPVRPASGGRFLREVELDLTLSDPNGGSDGDRVSLSLEYALNCTTAATPTWLPAQLGAGGSGLIDLLAEPSGTQHTLVWDALTDATAGPPLAVAEVAGASGPESVVAPIEDVCVRITPTDSAGLSGPSAVSAPFALGNEPPTAELETDPVQTGSVALQVELSDQAGDPAQVALEFCVVSDGEDCEPHAAGAPWRPAAVSLGSVDGLVTSPEGTTHVLVWNALAPKAADYRSPAQGVGNVEANVLLRVRGIDRPASGAEHVGPWSALEPVSVANAARPQVIGLSSPTTLADRGSAVVPLLYYVADPEGDPVDVQVQFSLDAGFTWLECSEYPHPFSEGRTGLASAPPTAFGQLGIPHVFYWDANGDIFTHDGLTLVRVRAIDRALDPTELASQPWRTLALVNPAGPSAAAPLFRGPDAANSTPLAETPRPLATADFNQDGHLDVVGVDGLGGKPQGQLLLASGDGAGGLQLERSEALEVSLDNIQPVVATDLNDDGYPDFAATHDDAADTSGPDVLRVYLAETDANGPTGEFALSTYPSGGNTARELVATDLNGDGLPELVVGHDDLNAAPKQLDGLRVWLNDASQPGSFIQGERFRFADGAPGVAPGDMDEDGEPELVLAYLDWQSGVNDAEGVIVVADVAADAGTGAVTLHELARYASPLDRLLPDAAPRGVMVRDFNSDGHLDVAVGTAEREVQLWWGDGTGALQAGRTVEAGGARSAEDRGPVPADLNADGVADMMVKPAIEQSGVFFLLAHTRDGVPTGKFTRSLLVPLASAWAAMPMAEDLDGDGLMDLIFGDDLGSESDPDPRFMFLRGYRPWRISTAGFADARDAALSYESIQKQAQSIDGTVEGEAAPQALAIGDINADGALDLVVASQGLGVHLGEMAARIPVGRLLPPTTYLTDSALRGLAVADFNHDGLDDVVVSTYAHDEASQLRVYGGSLDGELEVLAQWTGPAQVETLTVEDLDADGELDVVVGHRVEDEGGFTYGTLTTWLGEGLDGSGELVFGDGTETTLLDEWASPVGLESFDFSGDGAADLVWANPSNGELHVLKGRGDGTFEPLAAMAVFPSGPAGEDDSTARFPQIRIHWNDFNRDGIGDLLVSRMRALVGGDELDAVVHLGGGSHGVPDGTLRQADARYAVDAGFDDTQAAAVPVDVNGDGWLDFAAAYGSQAVRIWQARGVGGSWDGQFYDGLKDEALISDHVADNLLPADFNGDGVVDVAVRGGSQVTVMSGRRIDTRERWVIRLGEGSETQEGLWGIESTEHTSLYGSREGALLAKRVYRGGERWGGRVAAQRSHSLLAQLREAEAVGPAALEPLVPLTAPWEVSGDRRITAERDPSEPGGYRLRIQNRYGPLVAPSSGFQRQGLDLSAAQPRGVVFFLPWREGSAPAAPENVRLFVRIPDWRRAASNPANPNHTALPWVFESSGQARPRIERRDRFAELPRDPDGSWETGTGARFYVDPSRNGIWVLADALGIFQAFVEGGGG